MGRLVLVSDSLSVFVAGNPHARVPIAARFSLPQLRAKVLSMDSPSPLLMVES